MRSCHTCGLRYDAEDAFCADDGAELVDSDDELLGATVGSYRIVRLLGEGGMGRVYLALHPRIGSRVAVKLLSPAASRDDDLVQRFFAEAQLVNKVRHEGIVNVLDLDHLEDGRPFITMEFLDGEPLSSVIAKGPMALGVAANIGVEILEALEAAHQSGVVHRDLKPDNIFISPKGRVKLLDFGIAKLMPEFETKAIGPATRTGSLLGTPGYMAPEQVVGGTITGATDLYAVGAVLYEALTGTMAFKGTTLFELLRRIVSEVPTPPVERRPDLAGPFEALILRALSKKPEERHGSAKEMGAELEAIREGLGPEAWIALPSRNATSSALGCEDTLLPTGQQPLALGSEATFLAPGQEPLALGSEATFLAPGMALTDAAPKTKSDSLRQSAAQDATGRDAAHPAPTGKIQRSKLPWLVGAITLGAAAAAVAVVSQSGDTSTSSRNERSVAEASIGIIDKDSGAIAAQTLAEEVASTADAGSAAMAPAMGELAASPPANTQRPGIAPVTRKPTLLPPGPTRAPVPITSVPPDHVGEDGGKELGGAGVVIVETGDRHPKSMIRKAPDFNPKAFDAVAYLPKARKLAKQIYPDVVLTEFDVYGVGVTGTSNLPLANFEASYYFLSRSHAGRTLPLGVDEDRPCWVYVEIDKKGVTARIVERDECKGKARPNPKCSMRQVWKMSDSLGTPPGKSRAVAHISYLSDGWFFDIDALGFTESIPDKC